MTDQLRISDGGEIENQPLTWDGEPLYHPETVKERLFAVEAFEQMRGQTALDVDESRQRIFCLFAREVRALAEAGWQKIGEDYRGTLMLEPPR